MFSRAHNCFFIKLNPTVANYNAKNYFGKSDCIIFFPRRCALGNFYVVNRVDMFDT